MTSKSILVIDEDRNLQRSLALLLQHAGYRVATADRACKALDCLHNDHYDLVIIDSTMPDKGLALLPKVVRLYPFLAILILAAETSETDPKVDQPGQYYLMAKPVTPENFLGRVEEILNNYRK